MANLVQEKMPQTIAGFRWKIAQWAERRWWKRYLKKKDVGQYLAWKRNYWSDFLHKINLHTLESSSETIIDFGCGPAGIFMNFTQAKVTAVDPLLDSYATDLPHFSPSQYPKINFVTASMESFAPTQVYDYLFCINAINHVNDLKKGFEKLGQCAHNTSTLVISIDAHNHNWLKKIFQTLPGDILHPHQYNLSEYQKQIQNSGWKIEQTVQMDSAFIFNYYVIVATRNSKCNKK